MEASGIADPPTTRVRSALRFQRAGSRSSASSTACHTVGTPAVNVTRSESMRSRRLAASRGRYFTPRNASGTRAMMISALKMTAAKTALCGVCSPITFRLRRAG